MAFIVRSMLLVGFVLLLGEGRPATAQPRDGCAERLPTDRVTLNLRDASTATTLRLLAQQYRVNMIVTEDIRGTVTLDFFRVPVRDVFAAIIDAGNLGCTVGGDVLRVTSLARVRAEQDEQRKAQELSRRLEADVRNRELDNQRKAQELQELLARGPVREETIRLQYADAETVAATIQGILGLAPQGATPPPIPLPQISQLYAPSPPLEIPSSPPPPATAPAPAYPVSPDALAKGLTVTAYRPTNSIFIRYYARDLERIKALIRDSFDVPVPQIQIAAQMVITTLNALEQIGVQWGAGGAGQVSPAGTLVGQGFSAPNLGGGALSTAVPPATVGNLVNLPTLFLPTTAFPAGGFLLGLIGSNFNINLAIQALEVQGKARTLAEPKSVTLENAKASISRGFEVPYTSTPSQGVSQVQFKDALLKLEVTPRLISENGERKIRMKVLFENNQPDFSVTAQVNGNPPIFKRRQETEVVIRQGQRLVIGGVTNDTSATTTREVPLFAKIPVLGWLFRSREINSTGEELIVILTPSVVHDGGPAPKR